MRTLLALILVLMIVGSAFAINADASVNTSGPVSVTGPSAVAINSTFNYSVSVQQIFKNYSATMIVSGNNLTGASPISPVYRNNITSGPTYFSITAPSVQTTMYLLFQITGYMTNGAKFNYNLTSKVTVKQFTVLSASIKNPSQFALNSINVTFEVNDKYVGSKIVNISKNSTQNVTYQWVSGLLPVGVYTVTVHVNNTIVVLKNGNSYTFQIQSGNPYIVYIYIGVIAFLAIIVAVTFIASYYARKRRPKWKK